MLYRILITIVWSNEIELYTREEMPKIERHTEFGKCTPSIQYHAPPLVRTAFASRLRTHNHTGMVLPSV